MKLRAMLKCQKGQGTVEYALIVVAVVVIVGATLMTTNNPLRTSITNAFNKTVTAVNAAPTTLA
jgi:Flp pilus assembly pilin Flp